MGAAGAQLERVHVEHTGSGSGCPRELYKKHARPSSERPQEPHTEHTRPGLRVPTGLESGLEAVPQTQKLPGEEVSPHPEGHQTAPTHGLGGPSDTMLARLSDRSTGSREAAHGAPTSIPSAGSCHFLPNSYSPSRALLSSSSCRDPRPHTLVSARLLPIPPGPGSRCLSTEVPTPPCNRSSPAGMPGVHRLGSPGLAPVLARLASPVPGVWAVKEAIFSLCYPRNYLVSVLPWCSVHFCWKMLVCVSALRRNGDESTCLWGGRWPGGQRPSATSFCPLWEVLARGA